MRLTGSTAPLHSFDASKAAATKGDSADHSPLELEKDQGLSALLTEACRVVSGLTGMLRLLCQRIGTRHAALARWRLLHPGPSNWRLLSSTTLHGPWEPVVGLELHVQLASSRKLFSKSLNASDTDPNSTVSKFDAACPGSQPVLDEECLRLALSAALALRCRINPASRFDRKHYFYPDLPNGYQITQQYSPLAKSGTVQLREHDGLDREVGVRIKQIQLEQDTAKSTADPAGSDTRLIDLNRTSCALIEIVTEPDMRSSKEASAFVRKLRSILRHCAVSDGNMEEGSLRCDVNVSVQHRETGARSNRCEIKNVNGLGNIEAAIGYEAQRHAELLETGQQVDFETRGWDVGQCQTFTLRSKESAPEYRYMPDPDIPPIGIHPVICEVLAGSIPELPDETVERLVSAQNLSRRDASVLASLGDSEGSLLDVGMGVRFFDAAVECAQHASGKVIADWIIHDLLAVLGKHGLALSDSPVSPASLALLVDAVAVGQIKRPTARSLLQQVVGQGPTSPPLSDLLRRAAEEASEAPPVDALAGDIIRDMPKEVAAYRQGKTNIIMRMVGEGMRRSGKRADARALRAALEAAIERL